MADLGAAFGFYPQLNRRRQGSPADSANLPVDVLRGRLAGLLGLPADIANLLRSPSPTEMFGNIGYEAPAQFPYTTEKFLKDLPLAPTSRVGQVAGQAASFVPLNPMPAVRGVQKIGQMAGEELAATMMGQRPNSMMSKVVPQPLFAVAPEQGLLSTKVEPIESLLQTKPQAPVSDIGFYSATEQAALNLGRNKGTGQSFINDLMKAPDVKKEELAYTGLDDFLRDKPNVTKQEVQDFLANNRVEVKEVMLGGNEAPSQDLLNWMSARSIMPPRNPEGWQELSQKLESYAQQHQKAQGAPETSQRYFTLSEEAGRISEGLDAGGSAAGATKYQKYQLAGGENYREILLTLPENMSAYDKYTKSLREKYGQGGFDNLPLTDVERARLEKFYANEDVSSYQSSHFKEPNILAHMRVNDRVDADGKKMLLVEEIQSDWHQAGRERGYKTKEGLEKWYNQNKLDDDPSFAELNSEQRSVIERNRDAGMGGDNAVPDAPFKDTWYQLALKRLTKYAAENGYERIGLTTGKQQAGRYKLSNEVDEINVIGRTNMATGEKSKSVALDMKSGQSLRIGVNNDGIVDNVSDESIKNFMGKNLSEVVGKDIAKEIMLNNKKTISGEGLDIGGEGMKKYYDEIYPKFLDKYGKKYGASVGETQITTDYARDASGIPAQRPSKETIRYLDITPQMKEGTSKGQPLFAATPLLPATSLLDEEKRKEIQSLLE
jgi:hypothetical protein